jgi:disulfide bond formation protein DsbB
MKLSQLLLRGGRFINLIELTVALLVLVLAFIMQFIYKELPCPLCLLQRLGFLMIAYGFVLNFRFGFRPSHYCIILLSALFTSFVALRQIALHIIPGTGSYGSAIFGLHLYTWSFITSMAVILGTTLALGVDRQYVETVRMPARIRVITHMLAILLGILTIANMVSIFMECGFKECPDNPTSYKA